MLSLSALTSGAARMLALAVPDLSSARTFVPVILPYYLCQRSYVIVVVCLSLSVCLSISKFAQTLPKGFA